MKARATAMFFARSRSDSIIGSSSIGSSSDRDSSMPSTVFLVARPKSCYLVMSTMREYHCLLVEEMERREGYGASNRVVFQQQVRDLDRTFRRLHDIRPDFCLESRPFVDQDPRRPAFAWDVELGQQILNSMLWYMACSRLQLFPAGRSLQNRPLGSLTGARPTLFPDRGRRVLGESGRHWLSRFNECLTRATHGGAASASSGRAVHAVGASFKLGCDGLSKESVAKTSRRHAIDDVGAIQ